MYIVLVSRKRTCNNQHNGVLGYAYKLFCTVLPYVYVLICHDFI